MIKYLKYLKKEDILEKIRLFIKDKLDNEPEFFLNTIIIIDNDFWVNIAFYDIKNKKYIDTPSNLEKLELASSLPSIKDSIKFLNEFDCFVSTIRDPYFKTAFIYKPLLKKIALNSFEGIKLFNASNQIISIFFNNLIYFNINVKRIKEILLDNELEVFTEKMNFLKAKQMKSDFEVAEKNFEVAKKSLQSAKNKYERSLKKLSAEKRLLLELDEEL